MRTNLDLSTIPLAVLIGLGVVLVVQIALAVIALVNLYRRPIELVATGNKWVWVAVIVLFSFVGAILYFVIGRRPAPTVEQPAEPKRSPTDIAEALYGTSKESGTQ